MLRIYIFIPLLFLSLALINCARDSSGSEREIEIEINVFPPDINNVVVIPEPKPVIIPEVPTNIIPANTHVCNVLSTEGVVIDEQPLVLYLIYKPGITSGTACEVISGLTGISLWRAQHQENYCNEAVQKQIDSIQEEVTGIVCTREIFLKKKP